MNKNHTDKGSGGSNATPNHRIQSPVSPSDETLDALFGGEIKLYQDRRGYRFSLDSILLADFATVRPGEKVIDLGAGNGVLALILARRYPSISITGLELQPSMVHRAARNVKLNGYQDRILISCTDVSAVSDQFAADSFDMAICNPPYRRASSGRLSPSSEKQVARHETKGTLRDFVTAAGFLLNAKGRFACVYLAERAIDLLTAMQRAGLEPKRLQMVHPFPAAKASMILVEGVKGGRTGVAILPPLVIYNDNQSYTAQLDLMLAGQVLR
jgi:tRNA1Val (adenine37-N6)-methyltransferase